MSFPRSFVVGLLLGAGHLAPSALVYFAPYTTNTPIHLLTSAFALVFTFWGIAYLYHQWSEAVSGIHRCLLGAISGFGYYIVSCYWFGEAFVVGDEYYSFWALSRLIGSVSIACFWWALSFGISHLALRAVGTTPPRMSKVLIFATSWSVSDVLVGDFVLRIPLAPLSGAMLDTPTQVLFTIVGQHGATLVLILSAALTAALLSKTTLIWTSVSAMAGLSALNVAYTPPILSETATRDVAMIQTGRAGSRWTGVPDIDGIMEQLIEMSEAAFNNGALLVILPELAVPFDMQAEAGNPLIQDLVATIPEGRSMIVGYHRIEPPSNASPEYRAYNTTDMIGFSGRILASHNKTHLVPFGEYIPAAFQPLGLTAPSAPSIGYSTNEPATLIVSDVEHFPPFSLATCYEVMISGVLSRETNGAEWIINLSSEIMFGRTIAPQLLYNYVRMRSIETGLPIYRATTTGYTGAIFPGGIDAGHLSLGETGTIWAPMPPKAEPTFFRKSGYLPVYLTWPILIFAAFGLTWKRKHSRIDYMSNADRTLS